MGEKIERSKVTKFILDEIFLETFKKLKGNKNFDSRLISDIQKLASESNLNDEKFLLSILRGESP